MESFKGKMDDLVNQMKDLVDSEMADTGITCETSQKVCFLNTILEVDRLLNGTTIEDMKDESVASPVPSF